MQYKKSNTILLGDVGGTNARFALAQGENKLVPFTAMMNLQCADYPDIRSAILLYLKKIGADWPQQIYLAIAGPVDNQVVAMTNHHWSIDAAVLSEQFAGATVHLCNDFTSIAAAIDALKPEDCLTVGTPTMTTLDASKPTALGIIGPGTGLGIAGLIRHGDQYQIITGEGGHVGFAPETTLQQTILRILATRYGRVEVERLLSGAGLENIYWALQKINSVAVNEKSSAAQIFAQGANEPGSLAEQAVDVFFEVLGQVAGDLALLLGAKAGIYLCGGIIGRYPQWLLTSRFRSAFDAKGRRKVYMTAIPTILIRHPQPGLLGLSAWTMAASTQRVVSS